VIFIDEIPWLLEQMNRNNNQNMNNNENINNINIRIDLDVLVDLLKKQHKDIQALKSQLKKMNGRKRRKS
jgi:hypothetical protein